MSLRLLPVVLPQRTPTVLSLRTPTVVLVRTPTVLPLWTLAVLLVHAALDMDGCDGADSNTYAGAYSFIYACADADGYARTE